MSTTHPSAPPADVTTPEAPPADPTVRPLLERPRRADARRNYERILRAAREAFTQDGGETSLEGIARRAEVGIGTLYRNFPNRQALIEAVYVEEVEKLCAVAPELAQESPWEALATWLRRFVDYMATKQALAGALLEYVDRDHTLFACCRSAMYDAAGPLLARAQAAGEVRPDTDIAEIIQLVVGVAKLPVEDLTQVEHLLAIVLDGLRAPGAR